MAVIGQKAKNVGVKKKTAPKKQSSVKKVSPKTTKKRPSTEAQRNRVGLLATGYEVKKSAENSGLGTIIRVIAGRRVPISRGKGKR